MIRIINSVVVFLLLCQVALGQVVLHPEQGQRQDVIFAGKNKHPAERAFAYMPNATARCKGAMGGGVQVAEAGFTWGGSYEDEFCVIAEMIKIGKALERDDEANYLYTLYYNKLIVDLEPKQEVPCQYHCNKRKG